MFYSIKEAAAQLGVTYAALQGQIFQGRIPPPAMRVGSTRLFTPKEIEVARKILAQRHVERKAVRQ